MGVAVHCLSYRLQVTSLSNYVLTLVYCDFLELENDLLN